MIDKEYILTEQNIIVTNNRPKRVHYGVDRELGNIATDI